MYKSVLFVDKRHPDTLMSQDESAVFTTAKTLAELNTHSLWGLERPRKLIFKLF